MATINTPSTSPSKRFKSFTFKSKTTVGGDARKASPFVSGEHQKWTADATALAGRGTQMGDRLASGAAIGAGAGVVAGGAGVVGAAIVGAAVGGHTSPEQVNLGDPVWNDGDDD